MYPPTRSFIGHFFLTAAIAPLLAAGALWLGSCLSPLSAKAALLTQTSVSHPGHISYGPDALVDTYRYAPYVEPAIAADPSDVNTLVAAAETAVSAPPEAFVSHNGGCDWAQAPLLMRPGSSLLGDVQLATGPMGDIYFASLGERAGEVGIPVFVSTNHGNWFHEVTFVRRKLGFDHDQLTIDDLPGLYRGRIYISALYMVKLSPQVNACGLLWSSDGGRHFHGPIQVVKGWCFNSRPVVLSSGAVVFPFLMTGGPRKATRQSVRQVEVAVSADGGETFGQPHVIGSDVALSVSRTNRRIARGKTDFDADPVPQFAAGKSPRTHREVIYGVWSDMRTGNSRLLFTKSTDAGRHWTTPVPILTTANPNDAQYQVSLAVNQYGVLGVAYLQYSSATGDVTEMFADSVNAGDSFSRPVPLQSESVKLAFLSNWGYAPVSGRQSSGPLAGTIFLGFTQAGRRFPSGGDYVGMAVDRSGAFHPIWAAAPTGTDQIWTATARVGGARIARPGLIASDVTRDVSLRFGHGAWDGKTERLSIPVSLRNIGKRALYPPFKVTVVLRHNPNLPRWAWPRRRPFVVNADNGERGRGAVYVYDSRTVGDLGVLQPGTTTGPRIWKIVVRGNNPAFLLRVIGRKRNYESGRP